MKTYYCPYCNRRLYNIRGTVSKQTREHVIPQTVGGADLWVIKVCSECNSSASARCDSAFAKAADLLAFLSYEPFVRHGLITTLSGTSIPGRFKLRVNPDETVPVPSRIIWFWAEPDGGGPRFHRSEISHVTFRMVEEDSPEVTLRSMACKVALGGLYLAVARHHPSLVTDLFEGPRLTLLRREVARRVHVPKNGMAAGLRVRTFGWAEASKWLGHPEGVSVEREHRLVVSSEGNAVIVRIGIFSEFFAEVTISGCGDVSIPAPVVVRQPLRRMMHADTAHLGNILLSRPSAQVTFVITDQGQPILPPASLPPSPQPPLRAQQGFGWGPTS
ncbi:MAG: HNH endonuclease [Polyangiaceae bacterium]